MNAYTNKEYDKFVALNKEALKLHPSNPTILYNLAAGYSLMGSADSSNLSLQRLLSWNSSINYRKDTDFANLVSSTKHVRSLDALVEHYAQVKKVGSEYANFKNKRHLEDILLMDTLLFATDVYNRALVQYHMRKGELSVLREFELPVFALASKANSASIWVSTAKIPQSRKKGSPSNTPEILEIDVLTGTTKSRIALENEFLAGSMVFDKNDNLYVSNSSKPEILVLDTKKNTIVQKLDFNDAFNLQGITIDLDKNKLYVSDYIKGIAVVDIEKDYRIDWLNSPDFLVKGIDGLTYVTENQLLAIQNNSTPKRVIKLIINDFKIESVVLLDNNLDSTGEPTNGKYYEKLGFLYISNSAWPHYDKNGEPVFENWEEQSVFQIKPEMIFEE